MSKPKRIIYQSFFSARMEIQKGAFKLSERGRAPIQTQQMISKILKKSLILDFSRNRIATFLEGIKQRGKKMRENLFCFLFRNRYLGIWIFLCIYSLQAHPLFSQKQEENREGEKKKSVFEFWIKRQTYRWTPYDYTSFSEHSPLESSNKTDSVKQNRKVLVPLAFRYDNLEKKFRIEISAYEIELANANTNFTRSGDQVRRHYFNPMLRSEAEFNFYKILIWNEDWKVFAGAGIRNINKYKYGYFLKEGSYQEYFYTYGPQIVLNTEYKLWKEISVHLGLDLFYTEGNRFYKDRTITPDAIVVSNGNAGVKGIYRGYEVDLSLSYKIFDTVKLYVGYNYIYSYFSYYGFRQTDFNLGNPQISPFQTQVDNSPSLSHSIRSGNHDILQGLYLGIGVNF
ncbi:outer membrane protein, TIGR04327 family [Leptospira alstonii serovar Pingchang str. 80-412]|uniref:Outer membrane protein, TIGR04327 family n=3 Tax=Leptospira alstonii TaxID=28452 RepID=M6D6D3_9LEPT|nr:outer membrane protein, TIGR04327 family [Leptospira alstonii serovar Sichuan str. 79601]EQA79250.1 outer membrane protein, TIGR04327 family [Leptospira alstonii serovar Pingchang str. 80-412]